VSASGAAFPTDDSVAGPIAFTAAECEIVLRICKRHRSSLPLYLRSAGEEACLIDEIVRKLSQSSR